MKKIIASTFLFIVFLFTADAQNHTWTKIYEQVYGSEKEYAEQTALRKLMGYDFYRLIGYKSYYTNGPSGFLQQARSFSMDASETGNRLIYKLSRKEKKGNTGSFYFTYWLDKHDRVTKARFTGDKEDLAYLFLNYWPSNTDWTEPEQLQRGIIAEKDVLGEKVVFDYTSGKPFIEIYAADAM